MLMCLVCRTRARAGPAPSGANASKKRAVPMSPATGAEGPVAKRTRSVLTTGKAFSPGGTKHEYPANSGYTPNGCSDTGQAVLRMSEHHQGVPGHSFSSPAQVADSPVRKDE